MKHFAVPAIHNIVCTSCHLYSHEMVEVVGLEQHNLVLAVQQSQHYICECLVGASCHHHLRLQK